MLRPILKFFGFRMGINSKIGFSFILCSKLELGDNCRIGHFNIIFNNTINLKTRSTIGYLNILKGPFHLNLAEKAAIGNKNYFTRAPIRVSYDESELTIGNNSKITVSNHLDLTRSITFGSNSILAGVRSQMWTHGYYHAEMGPDRFRIDGEIQIGDNVYIGSGCIFNPGVTVGNAIHIGAGSVISKDLVESGMYVGQALRFIATDFEKIKLKLEEVKGRNLVEKVYEKRNK